MTQSIFDYFPRSRLNQNAPELQEELLKWVARYCENDITFMHGSRVDVPINGMLALIARQTPFLIYDLPELKEIVPTAFVDGVRCYFADSFFRQLILEELNGGKSFSFLVGHEMEHLRRAHTARMADVDSDVSNQATDIRINGDLARMDVNRALRASGKHTVTPAEFGAALKAWAANASDTIKGGQGTSFESLEKWGNKSENEIAIMLMAEAKNAQPQQKQKASRNELGDAVLKDLDSLRSAAQAAGDNAQADELKQLGKLLEDVLSGKTAPSDELIKGLAGANQTDGMRQLDADHLSRVLGGQTGQTETERMLPSLRNDMLRAQMKNGSQNRQGAGNRGRKSSDRTGSGAGKDGKGSAQGAETTGGTGTPTAPKHELTPEEVRRILEQCGLHETVKKLGYDDLTKQEGHEKAAKNNVIAAVNEASSLKQRYGDVMPGGHMIDYAVEQLNEFYRPVMSWRKELQEIIDRAKNKVRYDVMEPWEMYQASQDLYQDLGMESADDVPYLGSYVPGGAERPVILWLIDSSSSMGSHLLRRGASEALGMASENEGEFSAEVIILFADTLVRGAPCFVTPENVEELMASALDVNGRGGTNFTACLQQIEAMRAEGGVLEGRKIEHLIYFTDTFDSPPRAADMPENLPPVTFVAPKDVYFNDSFRKGISGFAEIVYFDEDGNASENEVDLDAHAKSIADKHEVRRRGMPPNHA